MREMEITVEWGCIIGVSMNRLSESGWFNCETCDERNENSSGVRVHIRSEHGQIEWESGWFNCKTCDERNENSNGMKVHNRIEHEKIEWEWLIQL